MNIRQNVFSFAAVVTLLVVPALSIRAGLVESKDPDKGAVVPGTLGNAWDVLTQVREFKARPDAIRADQKPQVIDPTTGRNADAVGGEDAAAYSATKSGRSFSFWVAGSVSKTRTMWWSSPVSRQDISAMPYYVLRYKARGQRRDYNPMPVIAVSGVDAKGKAATAPLLDASEVINDGLWHVVIGRQDIGLTAKKLEVHLSTVGSEATIEVDRCSFSSTLPDVPDAFEQMLPATTNNEAPRSPRGAKPSEAIRANGETNSDVEFEQGFLAKEGDYLCLDLSGLFNDEYQAAVERTLKAHKKLIDGGAFIGESISVGGVPFAVKTTGKNIIVPPSDPNANKGTVNVLGTELSKKEYKRVAREDTITIPASGKACEVCFILISEMSPSIKRAYLPKIPTQIHNADMFVVQLNYTDGNSDFAFPYSIADKGFTIQRFTGAYTVTADPNRELKAIVFHNRYYGVDFDLAAVTLNTGKTEVIPASVRNPEPYRVANVSRPKPQSAKITRTGNGFTLENGDYLMEVDTTNGFAVSRLAHKWSPKTDIALKGGGLEIQIGDKLMTGRDFTVEKMTTAEGRAEIELKSKDAVVPLVINLTISGDDSQQITFNAMLKNGGNKPIESIIRFPVLEGLSIGDLANTWLYFPKNRSVLTKESGTYLAPASERAFFLQFFDVFNPKVGIGLAYLTHNLDADVLEYSLSKDASGVKAFIQYPPEWHVVQPGGELKLTETCIVFHGGDWHGAFDAYKGWVKTWFKPVKAGGLDWWHKSFNLRAEYGLRIYNWTVPIFDPEKQQFRTDDIFKEVEGYTGARPDIVIFYAWLDDTKGKNKRGGLPVLGYSAWNLTQGGGNYYAVEDLIGGSDVFRDAIRGMQNKGVRVSLYTIPDRYSKDSRIGKSMGSKFAQVRSPDGKPIEFKTGDYWKWGACIGSKEWQDIYIQALKKIQQETGVNAIYVDVFPLTRGSACYSKEHGHEVPLNVNKACHELIRRLRTELPEGVVLWCEDACLDVDSQFSNGNITYYNITINEHRVKSYDIRDTSPGFSPVVQSVHRFAFPRVKQFGFPCGFESSGPSSHELRFLFFNGEGLFDCGYLLYDSRDLAKVRNWLAIQKEYADCFSSTNPTPLIETEAGEVYANEFPGEGRTAWTLFNGRFNTYRGTVLTVEHHDGATYYDAWNHKALTPTIKDGKATISLALDPQGLGCVIQKGRKN